MVYSMGGFYNAGPIQAGLAYERNEKARGAGLKDDAISLAGGFNFGIARVAGIYERLKYDAGGGDLKRDFYGVSGTFNLGPGQLYAFWGHANDGKGSAADGTVVGGLVKGSDTAVDQYEISYTYPLSKRTLTYIGYVRIDNDTNARYTFNINPINQSATTGGLASEGKPQGLAAGIVHFF
jgi:predicted porin